MRLYVCTCVSVCLRACREISGSTHRFTGNEIRFNLMAIVSDRVQHIKQRIAQLGVSLGRKVDIRQLSFKLILVANLNIRQVAKASRKL